MSISACLLIRVLRHPECISSLQDSEWDQIIRQARSSGLVAYLYFLVKDYELLESVPQAALNHLNSARNHANAHMRSIQWEIRCIDRALSPLQLPIVLLKGAAYTACQFSFARGRFFNDVDIMVPKGVLGDVEEKLKIEGWVSTEGNAYDQRYYREWMHELPPMLNVDRKTVLDVHHTILPETARLHPDPSKLLSASVQTEVSENLYVLDSVDMVLHSATHLFHDGELDHGLRDIVDINGMLIHFGQEEKFWSSLVGRAEELELVRPLYYALRYVTRILEAKVPDEVIQASRAGEPILVMRIIMDVFFIRALTPDHPDCSDWFTGVARWCLFVRSHYLRMPLHLLIPHLVRKAFRRKQTD